MMPTQLTVLTRASASSARMSPVLYSIMMRIPSIIPIGTNFDCRAMGCRVQRRFYLLCNPERLNAYTADETPGERAMHQEFSLLPFFQLRRAKIDGCDGWPVYFAEIGQPVSELR